MKLFFYAYRLGSALSNIFMLQFWVIEMSELISHNDCVNFFDEVLKLDENIRFVAIYDGQYHAKFREGISGYFREEEIKASLSETHNRWAFRKKLSFKIGEPKFAMAEYDKVNRVTFALANDGVISLTTELGVDIKKLVDKVIEIRNPLNNRLTGFYGR